MLLSQAEKDIKHAKEYIERFFGPNPVAALGSGGIPEFLSPIRECHRDRKCNDISASVKFGSEAEVRHVAEKPKAVYAKTPHPAASLKSPQLSSTPVKEDQSDAQSPLLACPPRAIDFEKSSLPHCNINDATVRKKSFVEPHETRNLSPSKGLHAGAVDDSTTVVVSPGLPQNEDLRDKSDAVTELDDIRLELSMSL